MKRPVLCTKTSITAYQSTLRNSPEEWRSYIHRAGSLNLQILWLS